MNIFYRQLGFVIFWFSLVFLPSAIAHIHGAGWPESEGHRRAFYLCFIFFGCLYPAAANFHTMYLTRKSRSNILINNYSV